MKFLKYILLPFLFMQLSIIAYSQENTGMPERSPEQEAVKQTEKLQSDLQLNNDQVKRVHEINLKYALERQNSNSRTDALKRIKEKDEDLQRVLNTEQYNRLQEKRYDRSSFKSPTNTTNRLDNSTNQRVNPSPRTTPSPTYRNSENNESRTVSPNTYQRRTVEPATDRPTNYRNTSPQTAPTQERRSSSSSRNTYSVPSTRNNTERTAPTQRSSSTNESNQSSSTSSSSRTEGSSSSSNRR